MWAVKRLDGARNWIKGRSHCFSSVSLRCRRLFLLLVVIIFILVFSPILRNFHPSKYLGSFHIDQAYVCLENRISHWKESIESKDTIVLHEPLEAEEDELLSYVGNGVIGVSLNGNRKLFVSDGQSLSIHVPYEALLTFSVEETHGRREATIIDLRRGLIHNIHSYLKEKSCVVVEHVIYADQNKPSLLVQEVVVNNHAHRPVHIKFQHNGHKRWKKSKMYSESYTASKPGVPNIPLSIVTSSMKHPSEKDTDMIVSVGSSSIAPVVTVPFESVKSLHFLTAVHTKNVPRVKPTAKAVLAEKDLRKMVVEELKKGIQHEESLREEQSSTWRKIWKSGVTVPVNHHPDTPAGKNVNITMYYVLSNLRTTTATVPSNKYPGRCYQGVPTMHTAMLWTIPKKEQDVTTLAMKWKKTLTAHGCESFFDKGPVYLHQAMVLSFGGFTFAQGHLEFAANPATLQTDISFHHIEYYGSFVSVQVLVSHQWGQAAEIKVWAEKQDKLFACEAGCQFHPVILNSKGMTFPVKITSPVTPLLYISNNESHLLHLRNEDFIQKVWKDTHFQSRNSHSFLPATFWVTVAFLIIGFHLYLVKLIYTECHRETRSGRFSR